MLVIMLSARPVASNKPYTIIEYGIKIGMYIYIILTMVSKKKDGSLHYSMEFTEQGIRTVKDSPKRSETFKNSIEKAGGKLVGTYFTLGQYDGVSSVEAPDDPTLCQVYYHLEDNTAVLRL